jgi:hypothetical protein
MLASNGVAGKLSDLGHGPINNRLHNAESGWSVRAATLILHPAQ